MRQKLKRSILGLILIGIVVFAYLFELPSVLRIATILSILFHAWMLGAHLMPRTHGCTRVILGGSCFLAILSLAQTTLFYAGVALNAQSDLGTLLFALLVYHAIYFRLATAEHEPTAVQADEQRLRTTSLLTILCMSVVTISALGYVLRGAWHAETVDSIRTVWPRLPAGTLLAIALLWMTVPLSAWFVRSRFWTSVQAGCALFATTAIAPLVYRIGFGFDGFLHLAGEKQILTTGTLNPKPLYYIGQYVLTTFFSRALDLPLESIDRWLVPLAAAILLPLTLTLITTRASHAERALLPFGLLLLPLAPFVATTPQSFAYVLGMSAIALTLAPREYVKWPAPILLGAWTTVAHPLAGIPLLLLAAAILLARESRTKRLSWSFALSAVFSLPILFYLVSLKSGTPIHWNLASIGSWQSWRDLLQSVTPWIGNTYVIWPAWATLIQRALPLLALAGSLGTLAIIRDESRRAYTLLVTVGILLFVISMVLKTTGTFAFLIDYERGNYAERVALLALFCLVIAALPAIANIVRRARARPSIFSLFFLIACGAIAAAQTYTALPRHDALVTGRGWSVGSADLEAVAAIDRDAHQQPYTVLANQSVSAAAISQFGFKRYHGDIFYYPIPTGGPLYQVYLRMVYEEPSLDTVKDAATLGGSDRVYVVLNDYWWHAEKVERSLSTIADQEWFFGQDGGAPGTSVRVYRFDIKSSSRR